MPVARDFIPEAIEFFGMDSLAQRFSAEALCHRPELLGAARRLLPQQDEAEDALQDALLIAWRKFPDYQPGTNCRAWLFRILRFSIQSYRRRVGSVPLVDEHSAPACLPDIDLARALARLSAPFRRVIELADIEERSYQEVARRLRIPIGTVMSRVHRARIQLRGDLANCRPVACRRLAGGGNVFP